MIRIKKRVSVYIYEDHTDGSLYWSPSEIDTYCETCGDCDALVCGPVHTRHEAKAAIMRYYGRPVVVNGKVVDYVLRPSTAIGAMDLLNDAFGIDETDLFTVSENPDEYVRDNAARTVCIV